MKELKIITCSVCGKERVSHAKGKCKVCYDRPFILANAKRRREKDKELKIKELSS